MIKNINIITWNARGINHKSYELFDFLIDNNIHICLATETWLKNNISLSHKNFFVYRNDRVIKKGGGVAIIIKKNLSHSLLPLINN
jgi:exonuclease III